MDEERKKEERREFNEWAKMEYPSKGPERAAWWLAMFGKAETREEVEERTKRQRARKRKRSEEALMVEFYKLAGLI